MAESVIARATPQKIVAGVIVWDKRVLLCLEKITSGEGLWWFPPGGKIESGESELDALHRELGEELGLFAGPREREGIKFRPYYRQSSDWFGRKIEIANFLAKVRTQPPVELLAGQLEKRWCSVLPAGGLISESVETLMVHLRLDGYLAK